MADPVDFGGSNATAIAPEGLEEEVRDMPVFSDGVQTISCWHLSAQELAIIANTKCVWLSVRAAGMPPVLVSGDAMVQFDGGPSKPEIPLPMAPSTETEQ